jgi:riboflavin kinase/FMN adenylyltransferase
VQLLRHLDDLPESLCRGAVTIGNFDGVHLGHARLVEVLSAKAAALGKAAIVFTLDPHPANFLRPDQTPPSLSWIERKADLLGSLGVDAVIAYPTDEAFLQLAAREFFDRILVGRLEARTVVEGPNFFFGRDRAGDIELLGQYCRQAGLALEVVPPLEIDGCIVSSSRIRELIRAGSVEQAGRMLTEPYRIRGRVVRGAGRGAKLGFPTVNLDTANLDRIDTLLPGPGIYAGRAWIDGSPWPAAISIGPNRTFDENVLKVEAHLIGYTGALYDRRVELDFFARLRDIIRFDSVDALIGQIGRDVAAVREIVARHNLTTQHGV